MDTTLLKDLPDQVGAAVDDRRLLREPIRAVHKPNQLHHLHDAIQIAQLVLQRREEVQRDVFGRLGALFNSEVRTYLARDQLAVGREGKVTGWKGSVCAEWDAKRLYLRAFV